MGIGKGLGKAGIRRKAQFQQIPAHDVGLFHGFPVAFQPGTEPGFFPGGVLSLAQPVRFGQQNQILRAQGAVKQLVGVLHTGITPGQGIGAHMQQNHILHILFFFLGHPQPVQKPLRNGHPRFFMADGTDPVFPDDGCFRLSQVMAQGGHQQPPGVLCRFPQSGGGIQNRHGVLPGIPLRVVHRILGDPDEGLRLRKPDGKLLHLPQYLKKYRGPGGFFQGFLQLSQHPFPGQGGKLHGFAEANRFLRHLEPEPGGKLRAPEYPQGVLREAVVADMAQNPLFQILSSPKGVHNFPGKHILHQGVYGKIPPFGRLFRPQEGIRVHGEIPVAPAGGLLLPGHGNVQATVLQTVDSEGQPHLGALPQSIQDLLQSPGRDSVDLHVHILALNAQEPVPDEASYKIGSAPCRGDLLGQAPGGFHAVFHALTCFPMESILHANPPAVNSPREKRRGCRSQPHYFCVFRKKPAKKRRILWRLRRFCAFHGVVYN